MKFYIKQNKVLFVATILVSVIASLGYVFMAILLQQLLDIAVGKDIQQFIRTVLFSIFYFAVLGIFLYLQSLLSKKVICKIMCQIRSDVFQGTVYHSIEDFNKKNTADYISIITNDVKMIEDNFLLPLFEVVQYAVIFTASFLLMIYFDIIVTICVIVAIAIMFLIPSFLGNSLEKRQQKYSSKLADFTVSLKDILSGFEIIKSYSMKRYVVQRFNKENEETISSKYSVDRLLALNEGVSSFLALMVQIVVLFLSAYFIITGRSFLLPDIVPYFLLLLCTDCLFRTQSYFISFCKVTTSSSMVSSLPSRISLATQVLIWAARSSLLKAFTAAFTAAD